MGEWRGHALVRREVERREELELELEFAGMKVIGDVEEGGGLPEVLEVRRSAKGCGGWAAGSFPGGNPFVLPATRCTLNYKRTLTVGGGEKSSHWGGCLSTPVLKHRSSRNR